MVGLNGGKDYGVWNKEANLVVKVCILGMSWVELVWVKWSAMEII